MWRSVGILWLLPAILSAAEIRLAAGTWRGTATVTVVVAADGTQTITVDVSQPITITGGGTTGPVPPVDPPVETPIDKFRSSVRTATAAVTDPNKAASQAAVSKLYAAVAGLPVTSKTQLAEATDAMWRLLPLGQSWAPWKVSVDKGLTAFTALDESRKAWMAVSEGVAP